MKISSQALQATSLLKKPGLLDKSMYWSDVTVLSPSASTGLSPPAAQLNPTLAKFSVSSWVACFRIETIMILIVCLICMLQPDIFVIESFFKFLHFDGRFRRVCGLIAVSLLEDQLEREMD